MSETTRKTLASLCCLVMLVLQLSSMSHWTNIRGIYDDLCYLRQAHLFKTLGAYGLNTDIALDTDNYFKNLIKPVVPDGRFVGHTELNGKFVIQFPPGPGFLLSFFPEGNQGKYLSMTMTVAIFVLALVAIWRAKSVAMIIGSGLFGIISIYLMINPIKASYSAAPSVVICAIIGIITAELVTAKRPYARLLLLAAMGFLLGSLFNLRIANILLLTGYASTLLVIFVRERTMKALIEGLIWGVAYVFGTIPTLIAQYINAGSPFASTYGEGDKIPPRFTVDTLIYYSTDVQGILTFIAIAWSGFVIATGRNSNHVRFAWVTMINCLVTFCFFVLRPIPLATPYYLIPVAALSLWTLLFMQLWSEKDDSAGELVVGPQAPARPTANKKPRSVASPLRMAWHGQRRLSPTGFV